MCGRYVIAKSVLQRWPKQKANGSSRFNVAPTTQVPVMRLVDGERVITTMRWGLVPFWAKDSKIGYQTFNARAETIDTKPAFRAAFKRRRCFLLADGYYEWTGSKGNKQPHYVQFADEQPMLLFGLWESWKGPKDEPLDQPLESCTIVTTTANIQLEHLHHRMPCMLKPDSEVIDLWLDPEFEDFEYLKSLLVSSVEEFRVKQVSQYVNKVGNDGPECLDP